MFTTIFASDPGLTRLTSQMCAHTTLLRLPLTDIAHLRCAELRHCLVYHLISSPSHTSKSDERKVSQACATAESRRACTRPSEPPRSSFASFPRLCLPSALPATGTTPQDKWVPLVLHCRPQAELGKDFERCSVLHAYDI